MTGNQEGQLRSERDRERLLRVMKLRQGGATAVPELIAELAEPTWAVRRAVVAALAEAEPITLLCAALRNSRENEAQIAGLVDALAASRQAVDPAVRELLNDPNPAVVCDAAQILGRREDAAAVPRLCELTRHEDDNVALAAVEALGKIGGSSALESLLTLAQSGNFFRTFPTIDVLGRSGDARALPVLLQLSTDPLYGTEAVRALGRLGELAAIPTLVEQLSRSGEGLVRAIAGALLAIHEAAERRFGTGIAVERTLLASPRLPDVRRQLMSSLKRADAPEQLAVGQILSWLSEESTVPALIGLLDGPAAVAQVAAASLRKLGSIAEGTLLEALHGANSAKRRLLVPILAGRSSARAELIACLKDEDSTVRALACDALARLSDASVASAIFPLLGDSDARVGQAALGAIQSLGSRETEALALAAVDSAEPRVRRAALRIIGYFGYVQGLDALSRGATDADGQIREAAIAGLPFIDQEGALSVLLGCARHESPQTRVAAVRALGHANAVPVVLSQLRQSLDDGDAWVRYYACQALGRLRDDSATEVIAALLTDGSGQVRVAAVDALARLHGARAFEVLQSVVDSEDGDLHRAALVALGISKRREALPLLLRAAHSTNPSTRLVALSALTELGFPEALPAIAQATEDADEGVRTAAEGFLAGGTDADSTRELLLLLAKDPSRNSLIHALARVVPGRVASIASALSVASDALAPALVAALARAQTDEATQAIRQALTSKHDAERRAAAAALVAMQDPTSAAALARAALSDPDAEVRRICAAVLDAP